MNEYRDSWSIRSNTQIEFDFSTIPSNKLDRIKFQLIYVNNSTDFKKKLSDLKNDVELLDSKIKDLWKTDYERNFNLLVELDRLTNHIRITLKGGDLTDLRDFERKGSNIASDGIKNIRRQWKNISDRQPLTDSHIKGVEDLVSRTENIVARITALIKESETVFGRVN